MLIGLHCHQASLEGHVIHTEPGGGRGRLALTVESRQER